jgi:hypothetical protein
VGGSQPILPWSVYSVPLVAVLIIITRSKRASAFQCRYSHGSWPHACLIASLSLYTPDSAYNPREAVRIRGTGLVCGALRGIDQLT